MPFSSWYYCGWSVLSVELRQITPSFEPFWNYSKRNYWSKMISFIFVTVTVRKLWAKVWCFLWAFSFASSPSLIRICKDSTSIYLSIYPSVHPFIHLQFKQFICWWEVPTWISVWWNDDICEHIFFILIYSWPQNTMSANIVWMYSMCLCLRECLALDSLFISVSTSVPLLTGLLLKQQLVSWW